MTAYNASRYINSTGLIEEAYDLIKTVYSQYAKDLKRYLYKKLGSLEDAEDIVQDTFYNLLAVEEKKLDDNPAGYTYKVAHNLALNRIRKNAYHTNYLSQLESLDDERTPERSVTAQNDIERVIDSLNSLPERQVKAFTMSRFDNKSYAEISHELNVSLSAVEKYISKTLLHLRTHFDDIHSD